MSIEEYVRWVTEAQLRKHGYYGVIRVRATVINSIAMVNLPLPDKIVVLEIEVPTTENQQFDFWIELF